jgi:DNA repair protein RecO (recombination protein O)
MYFSEKVLVLKTGRFKEYDLWVRFLSPTKGILTGFAFGGCKSRKRFSGCLDVLNQVLFKVSSGSRNRYLVLEEGTLVHGYPQLKNDASKLGMAVNSIRFVQQICPPGYDSSGIYTLMMDYLETMENSPRIPSFFPLLFRARAAFSHGYQPCLDYCCRCRAPLDGIDRPGFLFSEGKIICKKCRQGQDRVIRTCRDSVLFLKNLNNSGPDQWKQWSPDSRLLQDCFQIVESFVEYHLESSPPADKFQ